MLVIEVRMLICDFYVVYVCCVLGLNVLDLLWFEFDVVDWGNVLYDIMD